MVFDCAKYSYEKASSACRNQGGGEGNGEEWGYMEEEEDLGDALLASQQSVFFFLSSANRHSQRKIKNPSY